MISSRSQTGCVLLLFALIFLIRLDTAAAIQDSSIINPQAVFNEGNYLMEQRNYTQALDSFYLIKEKGYVSGPLYYNMALSYVYLDSIGLASYYFHRSAEFRDMLPGSVEGLRFIDERIQNRGTRLPTVPWYSFIDWFLFEMNHYLWLFISLFILNAGVLVIIAAWLYKPKRLLIITGGSIAIFGVILVITVSGILLWSQGYQRAIVIENEVVLYPEPSEKLPTGHQPDLAYEAYSVTLHVKQTKEEPGWAYIRMQNGASGWVPKTTIRIL